MALRELVETWSSLYSNSAALRSAISFAHVGGLVSGGGCAIAADLGTLKAIRRDPLEMHHLHGVHQIEIGSLVVVVVSGLLLMFADLDAYLASTVFWIKMALLVALIGNGASLVRISTSAQHGNQRAAARLRLVSMASLALWFAITLMGAVLPNAL